MNIFPTYAAYKDKIAEGESDGKVCDGRPVEQVGAHVLGANSDSIGVCLIGEEAFSQKQFDSLILLCVGFCREYQVSVDRVRGHSEYWTDQGLPAKKSCPNIPMTDIRTRIRTQTQNAPTTQASGNRPVIPTPPMGTPAPSLNT
jgi:hypothetical protein